MFFYLDKISVHTVFSYFFLYLPWRSLYIQYFLISYIFLEGLYTYNIFLFLISSLKVYIHTIFSYFLYLPWRSLYIQYYLTSYIFLEYIYTYNIFLFLISSLKMSIHTIFSFFLYLSWRCLYIQYFPQKSIFCILFLSLEFLILGLTI